MKKIKNADKLPVFIQKTILFFATGFFLSRLPRYLVHRSSHKKAQKLQERKWTGAGFIGAVIGVATPVCLPSSLQTAVWPVVLFLFFSVYIGHQAEILLGVHDDARIVIDEWIGAWIAVWGGPLDSLPWLLTGLILFRILDVWKGPWGKALQKLPGGWGVVMDDVAAGIVANLLGILIFSFT